MMTFIPLLLSLAMTAAYVYGEKFADDGRIWKAIAIGAFVFSVFVGYLASVHPVVPLLLQFSLCIAILFRYRPFPPRF